MKRNFLFSIVVVSIILFFYSCGKTDDLVKVVPKDAVAVAIYDGSKCSKWIPFDKEYLPDEFAEKWSAIKISYPNINNIFEKCFDDPNASGINFSAKNYAFLSLNEKQNDVQNIGFCFSIDRKVLEKNINLAFEDFKMDPVVFLQKSGNYTYTQPDNKIIIAWNDKVLMILAGNKVNLSSVENLLNQKTSESILSNENFKNFYENCKTANLWVASNIINVLEPKYVQKIYDLTGFDLNNNYGHIILDVNKKEIGITTKFQFNKSIQNPDLEKIKNNNQKIKDDILSPFEQIIEKWVKNYLGVENSSNYSDEDIEKMLQEMEDDDNWE